MKTLYFPRGQEVHIDDTGIITWVSGATIDADGANGQGGSGHGAYAPVGSGLHGLDDLHNAQDQHGNWVGILLQPGTKIPFIQGPGDPAPGFFVSPTSVKNHRFDANGKNRHPGRESLARR